MSKTQDDYGELTNEWIPFKSNIWAKKDPIIGKEFYSALTNEVQIDAKFTTGYFNGTTSEMRLKHNDRVYEIIGEPINIGDKNMELLFYCRLVK